MEKDRSLRGTKKEANQLPPKDFNEFISQLKDVTEKGKKIVDVVSDIAEIKDTLEAQEILDDKEIKSFGNYGAHIIVPSKYAGKKAKVIIKK